MVNEVMELHHQFSGSFAAAAGAGLGAPRKTAMYPLFINHIAGTRETNARVMGAYYRPNPTKLAPHNYQSREVEVSLASVELFPEWRYGAHNIFDSHVCYVSRLPVRQWRRGIRRQTLEVREPGLPHLMKMYAAERRRHGYPLVSVHAEGNGYYHLLYSMLNPEYTPWEEAVEAVLEGRCIGRAVSSHFSVHALPNWKLPGLLFKDSTVGYVTANGVPRLMSSAKCWAEAVSDVSNQPVQLY